jgi:flagellar basal-body rod protein FlgG
MSDTLQAIANSLSADVKTLATISQNVANMHTPGYRGTRAIAEFSSEIENSIGDEADDQASNRIGSGTVIDQRDGILAQTGRELDLALRGPGFFVIERDGKHMLIRGGAFRTDGEGRLVTANGDIAVGYAGPLQLPEGDVRVEKDGQIFVEGSAVGQLQIVAVADVSRLLIAGDGAYAYEGELSEWKGSLVQGALERANVDAAEETVRLMEVTRHAESVQRAISIYDKAMEAGINQIGN